MLPTPLCHMSVFTQPFKQSPWLPTFEAKDRQQGSPIFLLLFPNFCLRKCKLTGLLPAGLQNKWNSCVCFERQLSPEKPIFFPTLNLRFPDIRVLCEHIKRKRKHSIFRWPYILPPFYPPAPNSL